MDKQPEAIYVISFLEIFKKKSNEKLGERLKTSARHQSYY